MFASTNGVIMAKKTTKKKKGLWENIRAKQKRIEAGSGERMRKKGEKGAPTQKAIKASQSKPKRKK
jgi:hypothetical protein